MRVPKNKITLLALAFILVFPILISNNAFSHGDAPSTCENRYDASITSTSIDNGTRTFDPISDHDLEFNALIDDGYNVTLVLHTANASSQNSTSPGTTWYRHTAFNYGMGVCVDAAGPGKDVEVKMHVTPVPGLPDNYTQNMVEWGSWPETVQFTYSVVWHNATKSAPPAEEPPEKPKQDNTNTASDDSDDDESDHEPKHIPVGMISPFIFKNQTTVAPETDSSEQLQNIDILEINGTLASFHFTKEMQLYFLSGNWTMALNATGIISFDANFTTVRADGTDRQTYSLDNMSAVSDSDLIFGNDTIALTSALDYRYPNGTIARVNATIALERLNAIKIDAASLDMPVYGVVDKVVRNINGERHVMARQFDMI